MIRLISSYRYYGVKILICATYPAAAPYDHSWQDNYRKSENAIMEFTGVVKVLRVNIASYNATVSARLKL